MLLQCGQRGSSSRVCTAVGVRARVRAKMEARVGVRAKVRASTSKACTAA